MALPLAPNLTTLTVSPLLWQLLASGTPQNVEEIASTPSLLEECRSCVRSLEVIAEPAGAQMVSRVLAPLVLVYGLGEQSQSPQFWKVYNDVLSELPRIALERASTQWVKVGKFFPKPAEILDLAKPQADALKQAAFRARAAITPRIEAPKRAEPTPEELEAVREMLKDFRAVVQEKIPPSPKRKAVRGPVDDKGITEAGRAIIERMRSGR